MFTLSQQGGLTKRILSQLCILLIWSSTIFSFTFLQFTSSITGMSHKKLLLHFGPLYAWFCKKPLPSKIFFYSMAQFSIIFYNDTTKKVLLGDYSWAVCTTRFRQKKVANEKSSIKEKQGRTYSRAIFNHDYRLKLSVCRWKV